MAPKLSNQYVRIISRLAAEGAFHRAARQTILSQVGIADAKLLDEIVSLDDTEIVGTAMLSVTRNLGTMATAKDARVLAAFKVAGLNYKDPFHWKVLLSAFCDHHFSDSKTRPIEWNDDAMAKVVQDVAAIKRKHPTLNKTAVAKRLMRHHRDYSQYEEGHIRKMVRQAHNPKFNLRLRYPNMSDPILREIRSLYELQEIEWTPALEREQSELLANVRNALDEERAKLGLSPECKRA